MKERAKSHAKRAKRGFVYFITSGEVIQAMLTGLVTAIVIGAMTVISVYVHPPIDNISPVSVKLPLVKLAFIVACLRAVWWIRNNTEEWREIVEETTGEETADDDPDDAE